MRYWIHLAAVSGGVLYVMPLLMLVVLTVAIERCWVLAVVLRRGQRLGDDLARADPLRAGLLRILEGAPAGPHQAGPAA
jgi:biopolymer transport protein ExbB